MLCRRATARAFGSMRLSTSFGRQAAGATALPGHLRMTYHALTWRSCRALSHQLQRAPNDGRRKKPAIFISYSHKDEPERTPEGDIHWLTDIQAYLVPAANGTFQFWTDEDMAGGADSERKSKTSSPLATSASSLCPGIRWHPSTSSRSRSRPSLSGSGTETMSTSIRSCYRRFQRPPLQPPCWRSICGRGLTNPSPDFRVTTAVSRFPKWWTRLSGCWARRSRPAQSRRPKGPSRQGTFTSQACRKPRTKLGRPRR